MKSPALVSLLFFGVAACSSPAPASSAAAPTTNGVNDVAAACQIRAQWANASTTACSTCMALAETPRCPCADESYAGQCSDQQAAMRSEPTCDDAVLQCVSHCPATDCACIDGCYAGKAACRTKASAADGCLAVACDSSCR
jgi:hypothetical protein